MKIKATGSLVAAALVVIALAVVVRTSRPPAPRGELPPIEPGDTVFLGDSITAWGAWSELFPGQSVKNAGISGDVTAGVLMRTAAIAGRRPAQVFLLIGTNDLSMGVPQANIVANVVRIVDEIRGRSAETEVFVQSVLPRRAEYRERVESLNRALIPAIAGRATWVNLYPLFVDDANGSIADAFSDDELHLNDAGYAVWRDAIGHRVRPR